MLVCVVHLTKSHIPDKNEAKKRLRLSHNGGSQQNGQKLWLPFNKSAVWRAMEGQLLPTISVVNSEESFALTEGLV